MTIRLIILAALALYYNTSLQSQVIDFSDMNFEDNLVNRLCVDNDGDGVPESTADTKSDSRIDHSEALAIENLILEWYLLNIDEISEFKNLKTLKVARRIALPDLSENNLLENLSLNLTDRQITFTSLPNLVSLEIQAEEEVKSITISENQKLESLRLSGRSRYDEFTDLETIDISQNVLKVVEIDMEWAPSLHKYFNASFNNIETLFLHDRIGILLEFDIRNNKISNSSFIGSGIPRAQIHRLDNNLIEVLDFRQFRKHIRNWG